MRLLILFTIVVLIGMAPMSVHAGDTYKLSMLPLYSSIEINKKIGILSEYLSQKTGLKIEPVVTSDFSQYENKIKNGSIDFGYENPLVYTLVSDRHEVIVSDKNKFRGIIIARTDSGISTLEDLRGKKVSIVGLRSAGGYLSQKLTLMEAGIHVDTDCNIIEAVDNKQENVILSVYAREADAGFIRESALHKVDKFIAVSQIKIIKNCEMIPGWAFSIKKTLPEQIKQKIQAALLALQPNAPVLQALKIQAFEISRDEDYSKIKRALPSRGNP